MVKIALVDDHTLFRNGIKGLIQTNKNYTIVGEFSDGSQFIAALPELDADIVLMDISMPNMDGKTATQLALRHNPNLKVIVLTMFGEGQYIEKMTSVGAVGFINKDSDIQTVFEAIDIVAAGGKYIPDYADSLYNHDEENDSDALSEREVAVLTCICQGLSTPQIADKLQISKRTVDAHRAHILEKTGCNNTASLVVHAIKAELVEI